MSRHTEQTIEVDKAVGLKIKLFRIACGMSRQQLALKINVTHQQLQKYETGANRVTVGRLVALSKALKKPIVDFFNDDTQVLPNDHERLCIEVARMFGRIKKRSVRIAVANMIRDLSKEDK